MRGGGVTAAARVMVHGAAGMPRRAERTRTNHGGVSSALCELAGRVRGLNWLTSKIPSPLRPHASCTRMVGWCDGGVGGQLRSVEQRANNSKFDSQTLGPKSNALMHTWHKA